MMEPRWCWLALICCCCCSCWRSTAALGATEANSCDVSEFRCPSKDGQGTLCLPMDRWCNGKDDCDNRIDEPRSCTICNRTYYARLGNTYRLSLVRPRLTGTTQILPWNCWFNFTALGGHHGDRVLVGMEAFSVGQLHRSDNGSFCLGGQVVQKDSETARVDGDAEIGGGERMKPGAWCGEGWGQPITTSAGKWIQLLLTISDVVDLSRFRFDLTYRVVRETSGAFAATSSPRDNNSLIPYYGDPVSGTLCSRNLNSCDHRTCIIESPNFPGLYPRNVTCYYYIRHSWAPKNQTVLISLGHLEPGQSISVRTSDSGDKERRILGGRDCRSGSGDTLSVYNGATIDSPLLARLCGTGTLPTPITGYGMEMLVVFRSQAHDAPFNPSPLGASPGFRLTTRVRFTPQVSAHHPCRVTIVSAGSNSRRSQRQGIIRSPEMTLPANTSCRYEFAAREDQRVWITFLSYRLDGGSNGNGNGHNGNGGSSNGGNSNGPVDDTFNCLTLSDSGEVVERQCGTGLIQPSRLCPRGLVHVNSSTGIKPCRWQDGESYLSHTPRFTVAQDLSAGTALSPLSFAIRYEFITVDRFTSQTTSTSTTETAIPEDDLPARVVDEPRPACYQLLESGKGNGSVSSPRNALVYGRGGSKYLHCLYRFQAGKGEHTHLTINPFQSAGCARFNQTGCQACLSVDEVFWSGKVRRRSYQTCRSLSGSSPVVVQSAASALELSFEVRDMNWSQDDDHFYFVAEYAFAPGIDPKCWDAHQQSGKRGEMRIDSRDRCVRHSVPWHVQAPRGGHLVLIFPAGQATFMQGKSVEECLTNNRIFIYSIIEGKTHLYRDICLGITTSSIDKLSQPLYLYSAGWTDRSVSVDGLLVVASLQGGSDSALTVTWLSVFKDTSSKSLTFARQSASNGSQMACRTGCATLNACLTPDLWCDDHEDCPDGSDEHQCIRLVFWPLWVGLVIILLALTSALVAVYLGHHYYHARRYTYKPRSTEENSKKAKFGSAVTVSLPRHYEKAGPGS